jgi:hypothetical protein
MKNVPDPETVVIIFMKNWIIWRWRPPALHRRWALALNAK